LIEDPHLLEEGLQSVIVLPIRVGGEIRARQTDLPPATRRNCAVEI
jgi:hypothetical protein